MQQMLDAPQEATFVWVNYHLGYPRELAYSIGRKDLKIVAPSWLTINNIRGREFSGIVVDHAAQLTYDQSLALAIAERYRISREARELRLYKELKAKYGDK